MEVPPKTRPRLFLIDAYALIYRAYFAFINRPLTNARGENTSAPFGFVNFLLRIREEFAPDYLAVVFDAGTSERETEYPEYKATREKMPADLEESLPRIAALLEAFHDPVVAVPGWEADDIIGTLAKQARDLGLEAVIVSGDKDFLQLVGPGIHLLNPGRGGPTGVAAEWVDERNAGERFGIPPHQVVDYLALIGDSSDNIPGAPGIGPKTALDLLSRFGSLDAILERVDEIPGRKARESLQQYREQVLLSRRLVTIRTQAPITPDLEAWRVHAPDPERLAEVLRELEFRTLLDRLGLGREANPDPLPASETRYTLVEDPEEVRALVARIRTAGMVSIDTETSSTDPMRARLVGMSLALQPGEAFYLPFAHRRGGEGELGFSGMGDGQPEVRNLPSLDAPAIAPLRDLLVDPAVGKIGHHLKYDRLVLERAGAGLEGIAFDTMVASYLVDPARRQHNLDDLALDLLGHRTISYKEVTRVGKTEIPFAEVPLERARDYACEDVDIALRLRDLLAPRLKELALEALFERLELPLIPILAGMERVGVGIDPVLFSSLARRLDEELRRCQHEIHALAGGPFNLNSVPQLRTILFERLQLPVIKRTQTGPSTDAEVLEVLAGQGHPLPARMLEYREMEKLRSTYVDALPRLVHPETGRIHTSFNQTVAQTGRLSSSDPNLQNIPVRSDLGREIRRGFVAAPGRLLLVADYSQIELRILAHFSGDAAFVEAFRQGIDIHRQTASVLFRVPIDEVSAEQRAQAKTVNFGVLYGQGEFSLGNQLGIGREGARDFIEGYFERFPGVRRYLDSQVEQAREWGYVETLWGRRRYIPELASKNWNLRQFGERVAQNTPIQGTAADLIKQAMIDISERMASLRMESRLILQVHDELVFEALEEEIEFLVPLVVAGMEGAAELAVPLRVDHGIGRNWYDAKG